MLKGKSIRGRDLTEYLFYIAIMIACVVAIIYMLTNGHPQVAPQIKDGPTSHLTQPLPHKRIYRLRPTIDWS